MCTSSHSHIDFSSDVSTATRLCDGALVVIDVLEGMCTQVCLCFILQVYYCVSRCITNMFYMLMNEDSRSAVQGPERTDETMLDLK